MFMVQFLGLFFLSVFITAILLVPFIDFLYRIKLQRRTQTTKDPFNKRATIFDKFHSWKVGTPVGGGLLIIVSVSILTLWAYGLLSIHINPWTLTVLLIAFIGFGLLGLYDDIKKLANSSSAFFGLRLRHKLIIQIILAVIISVIFFTKLNGRFIYIHGFGIASLGWLYIPFAAFVIVWFANASNIADGLDGLASGLFLICL